MFAVGVAFDAAAAQAIEDRVDALLGALAPFAAGHYPNFVEAAFATDSAFTPESWERLRRVKAQYDPSDAVRGNHAVTPAD
jgi:FAD/FMN-containing dehydrogenase